jgi:hypothetical protein
MHLLGGSSHMRLDGCTSGPVAPRQSAGLHQWRGLAFARTTTFSSDDQLGCPASSTLVNLSYRISSHIPSCCSTLWPSNRPDAVHAALVDAAAASTKAAVLGLEFLVYAEIQPSPSVVPQQHSLRSPIQSPNCSPCQTSARQHRFGSTIPRRSLPTCTPPLLLRGHSPRPAVRHSIAPARIQQHGMRRLLGALLRLVHHECVRIWKAPSIAIAWTPCLYHDSFVLFLRTGLNAVQAQLLDSATLARHWSVPVSR